MGACGNNRLAKIALVHGGRLLLVFTVPILFSRSNRFFTHRVSARLTKLIAHSEKV